MGHIVEQVCGIETVGQLIEALKTFPDDMPIDVGLSSRATVYRVKPQRGESVADKRGRICIEDEA